jgi:hypothetical protein
VRDEAEYRRPDWREGVNVVMADGQAWALRKPVTRLVPSDNRFGVRVSLPGAFAAEFRAASDEYEGLPQDAEGADVAACELRIGQALLLSNYALSADELAEVLQFGYAEDDEEGRRIRAEVMDVYSGRAPKPSAGGGGSPPSTPASGADTAAAGATAG